MEEEEEEEGKRRNGGGGLKMGGGGRGFGCPSGCPIGCHTPPPPSVHHSDRLTVLNGFPWNPRHSRHPWHPSIHTGQWLRIHMHGSHLMPPNATSNSCPTFVLQQKVASAIGTQLCVGDCETISSRPCPGAGQEGGSASASALGEGLTRLTR